MEDNINKILGPLDEYLPEKDRRPARIRLYSSKEMISEGIPTTEITLVGKTYSCRNYSVSTPEDMDTVTRAAVMVRALCLRPMEAL